MRLFRRSVVVCVLCTLTSRLGKKCRICRNLDEDCIYTIVTACISVSFNSIRYNYFRVKFLLDVVPYQEEYRSVYAPVLYVCL